MTIEWLKTLRLAIFVAPLLLCVGGRPAHASMPVPVASATLDAAASDRGAIEDVQYWRHRRHWRRHHRWCRYHRC